MSASLIAMLRTRASSPGAAGRDVAWKQIVGARDRDSVPGEEQHGHVAGLDLLREGEQPVDHALAVEVLAADHAEAELLEGIADRARVVHRLGELLGSSPRFG